MISYTTVMESSRSVVPENFRVEMAFKQTPSMYSNMFDIAKRKNKALCIQAAFPSYNAFDVMSEHCSRLSNLPNNFVIDWLTAHFAGEVEFYILLDNNPVLVSTNPGHTLVKLFTGLRKDVDAAKYLPLLQVLPLEQSESSATRQR